MVCEYIFWPDTFSLQRDSDSPGSGVWSCLHLCQVSHILIITDLLLICFGFIQFYSAAVTLGDQ